MPRQPITPIRFTTEDLQIIERLKKRAKGEDLTTADVVRRSLVIASLLGALDGEKAKEEWLELWGQLSERDQRRLLDKMGAHLTKTLPRRRIAAVAANLEQRAAGPKKRSTKKGGK